MNNKIKDNKNRRSNQTNKIFKNCKVRLKTSTKLTFNSKTMLNYIYNREM